MVILQQSRETSVNITAMQCMKNRHIGCHGASTVTSQAPQQSTAPPMAGKNFLQWAHFHFVYTCTLQVDDLVIQGPSLFWF